MSKRVSDISAFFGRGVIGAASFNADCAQTGAYTKYVTGASTARVENGK